MRARLQHSQQVPNVKGREKMYRVGGSTGVFGLPQPDDRPAHVVHFTAAVYTGG